MIKDLLRVSLVCLALWPAASSAEPITLKLAFSTSDQSAAYKSAAEPFVNAVNAEGQGLIRIEPYFSGALGKEMSQQAQLVRDGVADMAYIIPSYTRDKFPDNAIVEMPGLYRDMREGTLVYTRLIAANALRGYEDFVVIGAYVTMPEFFNSRLPIASLADLKGKKIRVNNSGEALLLNELGATPVPMPVNVISTAIVNGAIDAALVPPTPLVDYGIKRVAAHHYMLGTSGAPLALVMNRQAFDRLPEKARAIVRKYAGEWQAMRFVEGYEPIDKKIIEELKAEPRRVVTTPSAGDRKIADDAFASIAARWAQESSRQADLLQAARTELAKIRATH